MRGAPAERANGEAVEAGVRAGAARDSSTTELRTRWLAAPPGAIDADASRRAAARARGLAECDREEPPASGPGADAEPTPAAGEKEGSWPESSAAPRPKPATARSPPARERVRPVEANRAGPPVGPDALRDSPRCTEVADRATPPPEAWAAGPRDAAPDVRASPKPPLTPANAPAEPVWARATLRATGPVDCPAAARAARPRGVVGAVERPMAARLEAERVMPVVLNVTPSMPAGPDADRARAADGSVSGSPAAARARPNPRAPASARAPGAAVRAGPGAAG